MLTLAKQRIAHAGLADRVRFVQADALTLEAPKSHYDVIVTHFFLDCFAEPELARLVITVAQSVAANGVWMVSEFRAESRWTRWLIAILYVFFRVTTGLRTGSLARHADLFAAAGFRWVRMDFKWDGTETERGRYDFSSYDRLIAALDHRDRLAVVIGVCRG